MNLDDPNAAFFLARGNPAVPTITYALENEAADVHALEVSLSLFETELLLRTPQVSRPDCHSDLGRKFFLQTMCLL